MYIMKTIAVDYDSIEDDFIKFMDSKIPGYSKRGQKMKIKVNDITIEGTNAKVKEVLEELEYPYYESESKGIILIEKMDSEHIRNSILKISKGLLELMRYEDIEKFTMRIKPNGLSGDNHKCLGWLCAELVKRHGLNQFDEPISEQYRDDYQDDDFLDSDEYTRGISWTHRNDHE